MTLYAIGLNHRLAPVAVREAFALTEETQRDLYETLPLTPEAELVLLTTCNRTEAFLYGTETDAAVVTQALAEAAGCPWPERNAFRFDDEAAVRHAIGVAAGVRSLVLGDAQIFFQVKEAYRNAVEVDAVGPILHRLFHAAFHAAKRVRTETGLVQGAASVSSLAVAAARSHASGQRLDGQRVLLLGAGQMGVAALKALNTSDLGGLEIANRSVERTVEAAALFGGEAVAWDERHAAIARADVVLVASGAREPVVHAARLRARSDRPALVIDIAVPRNVERAVADVPGYTLLDLDRLNLGVEATAAARLEAVPEAEAIVTEALGEFVTWFFHQQALQPTIQALRETFDGIRKQEIERHAHRISDVARADVERLTESIMQKLLAVPIVRLKSAEPSSMDFVRGIQALSSIFSRPGCPDAAAPLPRPSATQSAATPELDSELESEPGSTAARCPFGHGAHAPARPSTTPPHEADPRAIPHPAEIPNDHAHRNARQ